MNSVTISSDIILSDIPDKAKLLYVYQMVYNKQGITHPPEHYAKLLRIPLNEVEFHIDLLLTKL